MPDIDLAERAIWGDHAALVALVDNALPVVRGFARRLERNDEEGDALAQEAFVTALERLERYRGEAAFSTWVCGIALHKHADAKRQQAREQKAAAQAALPPAPDAAEVVIDRERAAYLWGLVEKLPEKYRDTLIAQATSETSAEAARKLGITEGALRVRLHRARLALRDMMAQSAAGVVGEVHYAK
jgi:RNA polymerase sigma-70 factor, ECF subfamily